MKYPSVVRNPLVSIFPVNIYLLIYLFIDILKKCVKCVQS